MKKKKRKGWLSHPPFPPWGWFGHPNGKKKKLKGLQNLEGLGPAWG
jgi:hypothetical protein